MPIVCVARSQVLGTALRITQALERWKNPINRGAFETEIFFDVIIHRSWIVLEVIGLVTDPHVQKFGWGQRVVKIEALHARSDECANRSSNRLRQPIGAAKGRRVL